MALIIHRYISFQRNKCKTNSKGLTFPSTAAGFAWYVPLGESRPWRKPLRERQAYTVAMEIGRRHGNYESLLRDEDPDKQVGSEIYPEKSTYGHLNSGPSLQVIFLFKYFVKRFWNKYCRK